MIRTFDAVQDTPSRHVEITSINQEEECTINIIFDEQDETILSMFPFRCYKGSELFVRYYDSVHNGSFELNVLYRKTAPTPPRIANHSIYKDQSVFTTSTVEDRESVLATEDRLRVEFRSIKDQFTVKGLVSYYLEICNPDVDSLRDKLSNPRSETGYNRSPSALH